MPRKKRVKKGAYAADVREHARLLYSSGVGFTEIGRQLGASRHTIALWSKEDNWVERKEAEIKASSSTESLLQMKLELLERAKDVRNAQIALPRSPDAVRDDRVVLQANKQMAEIITLIEGKQDPATVQNNVFIGFACLDRDKAGGDAVVIDLAELAKPKKKEAE